jgi:hypothetical protein
MGCDGGGEKHGKGRYEGKDVCFDFGEVFWHGIENQYTDNFFGCFVVFEINEKVIRFWMICIAKLKVRRCKREWLHSANFVSL